jgi:hypothetical protein
MVTLPAERFAARHPPELRPIILRTVVVRAAGVAGLGPRRRGATVDYDQAMIRPSGVPVSLARLRTRDGVWLDGLIAEPRRGRRTALIWVHGLG